MTPRERAIAWAAEVANDPSSVFVDTETTGLGPDAEICDIAIVDVSGCVLLDSLVKPTKPIPADAILIHGIDDAMVADAPTWECVYLWVRHATDDRRTVIYNADYDAPIIRRLTFALGSTAPVLVRAECALKAYADFQGTMTTRRVKRYGRWAFERSVKWWKLGEAAAAMGIENPGAHRALADAETTRRLVLAMAGVAVPAPARETAGQRSLF